MKQNYHNYGTLLGILLLNTSSPSFSFTTVTRRPHSSSFVSIPSLLANNNNPTSLLVSRQSESPSQQQEKDNANESDIETILAPFERNLLRLKSGSDIRGQFQAHPTPSTHAATLLDVISSLNTCGSALPQLTPYAAYYVGRAFAEMVSLERYLGGGKEDDDTVVCVGRDPRLHGGVLADWISLGVRDAGAMIVDTGIVTTPSMFEFCRSKLCHGGIMVTASHLPKDRNGLKLFTQREGGFTSDKINTLIHHAMALAHNYHSTHGTRLPYSRFPLTAVSISTPVDFFPYYATTIKHAVMGEVCPSEDHGEEVDECPLPIMDLPLAGLRVVLHAGGGSGELITPVLRDMGADVIVTTHPPKEPPLHPLSPPSKCHFDGTFPRGVPDPSTASAVSDTMAYCEANDADVGIMLDTDADRAGFVLPREVRADGTRWRYESLTGNRLIALLAVGFARKKERGGVTFVTDSVTSEGLATFLKTLGVNHYRYIRGYANVIGKAMELDAQVAIETSGHCAMKENGYLDDGTYTAVKVLGLLARVTREKRELHQSFSLLDLIDGMEEMEEVREVRMTATDGSIETTTEIFERCERLIRDCANNAHQSGSTAGWELDEENREGVRVRTTKGQDGSFFMLRRSLHDPLVSFYTEASSLDQVKETTVRPLLEMFQKDHFVKQALDLTGLEKLLDT